MSSVTSPTPYWTSQKTTDKKHKKRNTKGLTYPLAIDTFHLVFLVQVIVPLLSNHQLKKRRGRLDLTTRRT